MIIKKPFVLWITGLSGAGKTTIAKLLVKKIVKNNLIHLDGDKLREILSINNKNTFSNQDRIKIGFIYSKLAKYLYDQGNIVIVSVMALNSKTFNWNKKNIKNYFEVFIDVPIAELVKRDPKGIYKKYKKGLIKNVAGLDLKFDKPTKPNLKIIWKPKLKPEEIANQIIAKLPR